MRRPKLMMLKELKYKFILVIIILVESVLITHTCLSMYLTYHNQERRIDQYLETIIEDADLATPELGKVPHAHNDFIDESNMLSTVISIDDSQQVEALDQKEIGRTNFQSIVNSILSSGHTKGRLPDYHVSYLMREGKIAFVDTSSFDFAFTHSIIMLTCMIAATLVVVMGLAWLLSGWILRPIEDAWHRQRMFLSDASHELKTPLSVIIANTDILMHQNEMNAEDKKWIASTFEEAKHMKHMIGDLLELAKSDEAAAGSPNILHMCDVDLSAVVSGASLEFDAVAFEQGLSIEAHIDEDVHMHADPDLINRLVRILVDNACKYAFPHTVIDVVLKKEARRIVFSVKNMSDELSSDEISHIFDRFYRSDKARSRTNSQGGFGLGLSIAKGIVTSHNGSIKVTSSKDAGTQFTISFPCA